MKAGEDPRKDKGPNDGPDYPDNAPNPTHKAPGGLGDKDNPPPPAPETDKK